MNLHKDKEVFEFAIRATSRFFNVSQAIIEKDYYVTLFLKELVKRVPELIFKGGTSLSKCYKMIDRFSEDIDITLNSQSFTQGKKRILKKMIVEICENLDFNLLNEEETRSRRDYNCYIIDYMPNNKIVDLNPQLLVETVFMVKSFPYEYKNATCMIYDYLLTEENKEAIDKYNLSPFTICVQTLERTFIDKVFALCDYMLKEQITRKSRHIYDLYKLKEYINFDEQLIKLIKEVREERKSNKGCISANNNINISKVLRKMIDTEYYKQDYINNTEKLLSKQVNYEIAITVLENIIESGIFEKK